MVSTRRVVLSLYIPESSNTFYDLAVFQWELSIREENFVFACVGNLKINTCYLPVGRSVWWKTVTGVLKMLLEAAGRGQHFQVRGLSFSLYGPTLSRQKKIKIKIIMQARVLVQCSASRTLNFQTFHSPAVSTRLAIIPAYLYGKMIPCYSSRKVN